MLRLSIISFVTLCLLHLAYGKVGIGPGDQEWGYVTVRPGAKIFWWLHFTTNVKVNSSYQKPLIIWLQGGPGSSSTAIGNFLEIGPIDPNLNPRNKTWVNDYNVLFIDYPVGTGFSFVENEELLVSTNAAVVSDLIITMREFFKCLPNFRLVPTYIVGQSYGAKIATEFALEWYMAQKNHSIVSKLKGVALVSGWISPVDSVLAIAPYLLETGIIDIQDYEKIQEVANEIKTAVNSENWINATNLLYNKLIPSIRSVTTVYPYNVLKRIKLVFKHQTFEYTFDFSRNPKKFADFPETPVFNLEHVMNNYVKNTLKLEKSWVKQYDFYKHFKTDIMKPVTHIVTRLLEDTDLKVTVYTGQLDVIISTPGTLKWVENLNWKNITDWKQSKRRQLVINNVVEGYIKQYKKFSFVWVNRAGHWVPPHNAVVTLEIIKRLTQQ